MFDNWESINQLKINNSGNYDRDDVNQYLSGLMSDFSRVKSAMQRNVDDAKAEKLAAIDEMNSLKDKLEETESERSQLESLLSEMQEAAFEEQRDKMQNQSDETSITAIEPFYNTALMSDSGNELLAMLRGLAGTVQGEDSSVVLSKAWEEEESVTDPDADGGNLLKTIKRRTEISIKYVPGSGRTE